MKTTFNTLYLPIKAGIEGNIMTEIHKVAGETIMAFDVDIIKKPIMENKPLSIVFQSKGQVRRYVYGTTRKEIKAAVNDINDFRYDPHLFINQ